MGPHHLYTSLHIESQRNVMDNNFQPCITLKFVTAAQKFEGHNVHAHALQCVLC